MRSLALALITSLSIAAVADTKMVISPEEAKELIGKPNVLFINGDKMDDFKAEHIPGSISMDAHHLHHSDNGVLHCAPLYMCLPEAQEYIEKHGITKDTYIVAYDQKFGANATGVYHFFKTYGHKNVSIANGGMEALKKIGVQMEINTSEPHLKKSHYNIKESDVDTSSIVSKDDVLKAVLDIEKNGNKSKYIILDSRHRMEEILGYPNAAVDNVARGGHIPGAKFAKFDAFIDMKGNKYFKSPDEMDALLKKLGVTKDKEIITYCHVGAGRGSYLYTVLKQLGYDNVKVYTGSYDEWGNDFNMPIRR